MPEVDIGVAMQAVVDDVNRHERLIGFVAMPIREVAHGVRVLDQRFGRLEKKVDQLDEKVDKLDGKVAQLDQKVAQLDQKVGQLDQKVGQLDQKVGQLDQKFDQLDRKVDRLEKSMDLKIGLLGDDVRKVLAHVETLSGFIARDELTDKKTRDKLADEKVSVG